MKTVRKKKLEASKIKKTAGRKATKATVKKIVAKKKTGQPRISKASQDKINEAYNKRKTAKRSANMKEGITKRDLDIADNAVTSTLRSLEWKFDRIIPKSGLRLSRDLEDGRWEYNAYKDHCRGGVFIKYVGKGRIEAWCVVTAKDGDVKTYQKSGTFSMRSLSFAHWYEDWIDEMCAAVENYSFKPPKRK